MIMIQTLFPPFMEVYISKWWRGCQWFEIFKVVGNWFIDKLFPFKHFNQNKLCGAVVLFVLFFIFYEQCESQN